MRYRIRIISIVVFILLLLPIVLNVKFHRKSKDVLKTSAGMADLSSWNTDINPVVELSGKWVFNWSDFIDPSVPPDLNAENSYLDIPGLWNSYEYNGEQVGGKGYATLRLLLRIPESLSGKPLVFNVPDMYTSFRMYINGGLVCSNGTPGTTAETTRSYYFPQSVRYVPDSETVFITLHIANFQHWKGGTSRSIKLGTESYMLSANSRDLIIEIFLFSLLVIMFFMQLLSYFFRRKNFESLVFAICCLLFAARTSVTGGRLLYSVFPDFSWYAGVQINYISLYIALPSLLLYFSKLFPWKINDYFARFTVLVGIITSLSTIFTPMVVFTHFLKYFQIFMVLCAIILMMTFVRAYNLKQHGIFVSILSIFYLILIGINDTLHNNGIIESILLYNFGLSVFCFSQLVVQTYRYNQTFYLIEQINSSLWRFVPHEFLDFLGKKDILEAGAGDRVEEDLCVMFIDIRGFTSISESLDLDDNFRFLNSYLETVSPIIRSQNGFVDKFIGDGILALFPGESDNAVRAAINVCRALENFNRQNREKGISEISIGIGINRGRLMLGIIGESFRLDTTVISDVVNVASRIEDLNKRFNVPIIVSDSVIDRMNDKSIRYRPLGAVGIRGRKESIAVNEILGVDPEEITKMKLQQLSRFRELQVLVSMNHIAEASEIVKELLAENSTDRILQYYKNVCGISE